MAPFPETEKVVIIVRTHLVLLGGLPVVDAADQAVLAAETMEQLTRKHEVIR